MRISITNSIIAHAVRKKCHNLDRRKIFMLAGFIIGVFIGGFFGVGLMCLLYYSRE